jgi:glycosyltransferase involved in cell wall biosynthesis
MSAPDSPGGELAGLRVAMIIDHPGFNDARAVRQIQELVHQGAEVKVWASENRKDLRPLVREAHGAVFRQFPADWRRSERVLRRVRGSSVKETLERRLLKEVPAWHPDVIAHHEVRTLEIGARLADHVGVPLLSDLPDLPSEIGHDQDLAPGEAPAFLPKPERDAVMRSWYGAPAARLTVAPGLARLLSTTYGVPQPDVLLNVPRRSLATSTGTAGGVTVRQSAGLGPTDPLAVYVGDVKLGRNFETILEALRISPRWTLAVVGANPLYLAKFQRQHPLPVDLADRVRFIDRQPDATLPEFLADADVGIHVQRGRTFNAHHAAPNKYFVMALAGLPLIVSGAFMSEEVERLGIGVALPEPNAELVAAALERPLNDYRASGPKRDRVQAEYSWERQADVLIRNFRLALGRT